MFDVFRFLKRSGRSERYTRKPRRNAIGRLGHRGRPLGMEPLEDRRMLAVTPLSVVLVSDAVAQAQQVCVAAAKETIAIVYHSDSMSTTGLVNLLASVSAEHNGARIGHLGIMAHGGPGEIDLGSSDDLSLATMPSQVAALEQLRSVLTNDARLDLYSCSVAAGSRGKTFVDDLAAVTGAAVFASDNPVGTVPGSDFVWEYHTGQSVASKELFSAQEIESIPSLCLSLPAPTLSNPTNGATGVSTRPTFSWSQVSGNVGYRIIVSTNLNDLPTDPSQPGGTPSNGFNVTVGQNTISYAWGGSLTAGATYYWEVHALGSTQYGTGRTGTALPPSAASLLAPTLSSPANGATGVSTRPTFSWSQVSGNSATGSSSRPTSTTCRRPDADRRHAQQRLQRDGRPEHHQLCLDRHAHGRGDLLLGSPCLGQHAVPALVEQEQLYHAAAVTTCRPRR